MTGKERFPDAPEAPKDVQAHAVDGNHAQVGEERIAQLRQALVNQARIIVELRREVSRLQLVEETAFPRRKKFNRL